VIAEPKLKLIQNSKDDTYRIYSTDGIARTLRANSGGLGSKTGVYAEPKKTTMVMNSNKNSNCKNRIQERDETWALTGNSNDFGILTSKRTEYGKKIRKQYEAGDIKEKRKNMTTLKPRTDDITNTLSTVEKDNYLYKDHRIRKLTPTECERLQGFPDGWTKGVSDTQRYKQLGNAVTATVVEYIAQYLDE